MSFQDKTLRCADCGTDFTFSADEQSLFASRGYTNEPKRCNECRQARKSERPSASRGGYGSTREMHPATCAQCGKETTVPFKPSGGRPVYCSDCYSRTKSR